MPSPRNEIHRWPDWLRPALVDGYGVKVEDRRVRSDFDIGSQFRIEFDTDETVASCSLFLDRIQADWFEAFERDILVQGSRWFLMPLWVGGKLIDHLVRFRSRPELSEKRGDFSRYSFQLDVSKREGLMDSGLVWILMLFSPQELLDFHERIHNTVNFLMPGCSNVPEDLWQQ